MTKYRVIAKKIMITILAIISFAWMSCNNLSTVNTTATTTRADTIINTTDTATNQLAANNDSTTTNADWLLIPGVAAGQTKLNENADSVYQRFGTPDGGDAAMMKAIAVWYSNHDSTGNLIAIYTSRNPDSPFARVQQIRITSPVFKTAAGIHTSSALQEIKDHFPVQKTETYQDAGTSYAVYDSKKGIAFEINPDSVCVAIVIHKAGVIDEGTYLKFRTTNKFINRSK